MTSQSELTCKLKEKKKGKSVGNRVFFFFFFFFLFFFFFFFFFFVFFFLFFCFFLVTAQTSERTLPQTWTLMSATSLLRFPESSRENLVAFGYLMKLLLLLERVSRCVSCGKR